MKVPLVAGILEDGESACFQARAQFLQIWHRGHCGDRRGQNELDRHFAMKLHFDECVPRKVKLLFAPTALVRYGTVTASGRAYHLGMKRDLPVTYCTKCGSTGYNIKVAGGRCCKNNGGQRCEGINAMATKALDWGECVHCQATGYYRNKECPECKGAGYLFVGQRDTATL